MKLFKDELEEIAPVLSLLIVIACIIFIPLKVTGYGYLPSDDALRHSAKVISGKAWNEILILRPEIKMDNHPGWHAVLGFVHNLTRCGQDSLVVFSVVVLFLLFSLLPIFFLHRPEAWLATLLTLTLTSFTFIMRLFAGRPYIVTMAMVVALAFLWPKLKLKKFPLKEIAIITFLAAVSTWVHGSWHLFSLPLAAFLLAREWRAFRLLLVSILSGVALGALLTGTPYQFLEQNALHSLRAFSSHTLTRMLVGEFQPFEGNLLAVVGVLVILTWRRIGSRLDKKIIDNPIFILAVLGWVMGFIAIRFWLDWGLPALSVWLALEFQNFFEKGMKDFSFSRVLLTLGLAATLFLTVTNDANSRWTYNLTKEYLSIENPEHKEWLPEKGGIIYNDDMTIFYDTFFKNPHGPWRYILGFEPTLMPQEDIAIFRKIQWNYGAYEAFEPWVKKMKPQDRLIIRRPSGEEPKIKGLEWHYTASGIWVGRLPRER